MTNTTANPATTADISDEPTQAEMNAFNNFDPIQDIPSPIQIVGDVRLNAVPTMASFSPEQQVQIRERMGNSNSEASASAAIHSFLLDQRRNLLIKGGAGQGATQTQRTMLEQARRVGDLNDEIKRIDAALDEVVRHDTVTDSDGTVRAAPVYQKQGEARRGYEARKTEALREMALIAGFQGEKELKDANRTDALNVRAAQQQIDEYREAQAMAKQISRDSRVRRMAESKARLLGDTNVTAIDLR
jgi:hypothetical protein